ncbi:hypothetical protein H0H81_005077, partial [Sphagnurus paluster]
YEPMLPQSYRLGDIVKIQLLFQTVSVERNARRKMLAILRAVTLLDGSFKPKKMVVVVEAPLRLKRKVSHNFGDKSSSAKSTHKDEPLDKRIRLQPDHSQQNGSDAQDDRVHNMKNPVKVVVNDLREMHVKD